MSAVPPAPGAPVVGDASAVVLAPLAVEALAVRRGAPDLRVARAGMGPERARRCALRWRGERVSAVAVAGLCGSLTPELGPGDVVVPDELRLADGTRLPIDAAPLREILAASGERVHGGALLGIERAVTGAGRAALRDTGAVVVDMESPWLAAAGGERPFVVLRVVVDGPDHELFRLDLPWRGLRALGRLSAASASLSVWARSVAPAEAG